MRSSFCAKDACVEVEFRSDRGEVIVTRSDRVGHEIGLAWFTREEWEAFVKGVKAGEFDWTETE